MQESAGGKPEALRDVPCEELRTAGASYRSAKPMHGNGNHQVDVPGRHGVSVLLEQEHRQARGMKFTPRSLRCEHGGTDLVGIAGEDDDPAKPWSITTATAQDRFRWFTGNRLAATVASRAIARQEPAACVANDHSRLATLFFLVATKRAPRRVEQVDPVPSQTTGGLSQGSQPGHEMRGSGEKRPPCLD
jgi:hypothetical protein